MSGPSRIASFSAPIKRAIAAALLLSASPALADRALLIGTGSYPALLPALRLAAPSEDARRLREALIRAGLPPGAVTVMSDVEGTAPTRAAVLAALAALARSVRPHEQVLLYFSGHGAQAPALDPGLEPDGLDELYLMQDAAGWDGGLRRVPGSIGDAELARAIDAIRTAGADIWFVADTCHAGGLMRGNPLPSDSRPKRLTAAELGIPAVAADLPIASAKPSRPPPAGRFAAFYAAAPGALAIERRLPLGAADARPLSQFSFALVRALDAGRLRSLRDLAVALNAVDLTLGGGAPQPSFQGALTMSVLGLPGDRPRRFLARRDAGGLMLDAGREEGLVPGMRFRLFDPHRRTLVGAARAIEVRLASTRLVTDAALAPGAVMAEPLDPPAPVADSLVEAAVGVVGQGVARDITVAAQLWRPGSARACPTLDFDGPPAAQTRPIDLLAPPPLRQCDVVVATIANAGGRPIDVSPFYLDAAGRLTGLSFLRDAGLRLAPRETRRVAVRLLSIDGAGRPLPVGGERLLLVALPGTATRPIDLRGTTDPAWRSGEDVTLDAAAGALIYRWTVVP